MTKAHRTWAMLLGLGWLGISASAHARMSPRQIYQSKADGVVLIVASKEGSSSSSAGTGSIIQRDGTIVTNCHVIWDASANAPYPTVHVFLKPAKVTGDMNRDLSRHYNAQVVAYDNNLDLALVRMKNPPANLTVITLGDPNEIGPGDETIAIGHPEQGGLWTITTGVIGTEFEDFKGIPGKNVFQMETSLNRGNSGGPLFDVRGYQVGVNTAIARQGEGGVAITGVNFAIKSSVVRNWSGKHQVQLAYGPEQLDATAPAQVASAPAAPPRQPAQAPEEPDQAYRDPDGRGKITVSDTPASSDQVRTADTPVSHRQPRARARKPVRFKKHYRLPPRPYTFRRLFTAVDKVRDNARKAFDDLDMEIQRRR